MLYLEKIRIVYKGMEIAHNEKKSWKISVLRRGRGWECHRNAWQPSSSPRKFGPLPSPLIFTKFYYLAYQKQLYPPHYWASQQSNSCHLKLKRLKTNQLLCFWLWSWGSVGMGGQWGSENWWPNVENLQKNPTKQKWNNFRAWYITVQHVNLTTMWSIALYTCCHMIHTHVSCCPSLQFALTTSGTL